MEWASNPEPKLCKRVGIGFREKGAYDYSKQEHDLSERGSSRSGEGSHPYYALSAEGSYAKASTKGCLIPRTSMMSADTVA
jgi:hypothetical protein